jgi:hypothetical protein
VVVVAGGRVVGRAGIEGIVVGDETG